MKVSEEGIRGPRGDGYGVSVDVGDGVTAVGKRRHGCGQTAALSAAGRTTDISDDLSSELERAHVVKEEAVPGDVAKMGSQVRYTTESGEVRTVTLVFPGEADMSEGRISIMTRSAQR